MRDADDAYTKQYYFNEEGDLKWGLIQYPEDKIEIKVNLGINETIDVTEWYFGGKEGGAPGFIEDGIKKNL